MQFGRKPRSGVDCGFVETLRLHEGKRPPELRGDRATAHRSMTNISSGDVLEGAAQIAEFLYGSSDTKRRRRIFYLAERRLIPVFRMGETICARRSTLTRWMSEQECARSNTVTDQDRSATLE